MTEPRTVNPMTDFALLRLAEFIEDETDIDYEMTTKRVKRGVGGLSCKIMLKWPKNAQQITVAGRHGTEAMASEAAKIIALLDEIDPPEWAQ